MNHNIFFKWHSTQLLRRMRPSVDTAMESLQDIVSEKAKHNEEGERWLWASPAGPQGPCERTDSVQFSSVQSLSRV